jgi:hypothetical protein
MGDLRRIEQSKSHVPIIAARRLLWRTRSSAPTTDFLAPTGHGYETVDQLRGQLSQRSVPDPATFERANYIKTLASRTAPSR